MFKALLGATLIALVALPARAAILHETFFFDGTPTPDLVAFWSSLPGSRAYLIKVDFPTSYDLDALFALRGADRLQIEVARFPTEDTIPAWKRLAERGAELVVLDGGIPREDEIPRLNEIGFARQTYVMTSYPDASDSARVARIRGALGITFASRMYPRGVEKPGLAALPAFVPLLFSTDYYPWYTHMDVLNMLTQLQRIRVKDMFPPEEEVQYLLNIQRLQEVIVDTDYDAPTAADWDKFAGLPVRWSSRGRVPSAEGLAAYERSGRLGPRRLTIDSDIPFSDDERARLTRSPVATDWIHLAPFYR